MNKFKLKKSLSYSYYKKVLIILMVGVLLTFGLAVYSFNFNKEKDIELKVYKKGIYVVSIDSDYFGKNSDIYVSKNLETVEKVAKKSNVKVAINAGFFDPKNEKTTSFVLKNNEIIADPQKNESLTSSEAIKPYFNKILNRTEFRVLKCPSIVCNPPNLLSTDLINFEIKKHNEPFPPKSSTLDPCSLLYSVQAGPELLPNFNLEEEFFVLKKDNKVVRESASALKRFARSAIGIRESKGFDQKGRIFLVAVSNKSPMTLEQLSHFMKKIGVEDAMAFDGGSSTSLYVDIPEKKDFILNSAKDNAARKVKSILIVR